MSTIVPFLKNGSVFDPKDIAAMSMALDDVCNALDLRDDSSARQVIAVRIIDLAKAGERSPTRFVTGCARGGLGRIRGLGRGAPSLTGVNFVVAYTAHRRQVFRKRYS